MDINKTKVQLQLDPDELARLTTRIYHESGYSLVHDDTDNLHIHLIINKIHPERRIIHTPRRDFKILAELCAKLERENSLTRTNHEAKKSAVEAKVMDMEAHCGAESFLSYVRKKATPILAAAQSWEKRHRALAETGITLRLKGNGLVMTEHAGTVVVKASSVANARIAELRRVIAKECVDIKTRHKPLGYIPAIYALRIAMAKFNGQPLMINGMDKFKGRCIDAAIRTLLPVTFSDAAMEKTDRDRYA